MSKHQFRILSLDGGGIKGIIPCTILSYIEQKTGHRISKMFHLLAGTSTGGIISLGLTTPNEFGYNAFTADDMLQLYVKHGTDIFHHRDNGWFGKLFGTKILGGALKKVYDEEEFEKLLQKKFGDNRLKESLADVLVTTYAPEAEKPFYFSSRLAKKDAKEDMLVREIARSTSAAPTYFEPSRVKYDKEEKYAFVDGGVFANNPSILAYGEAKELWKNMNNPVRVSVPSDLDKNAKTFDAYVTPDDHDLPFFMLSIGCGHAPAKIDLSDAEDWRMANWIKPLLTSVFMQSVAESTDYTMKHLLPPFEDKTLRYIRLDLEIPEANSQMDDVSEENIKALCKIADQFVKENQKKLDDICNLLA
jgi:patatin-like phospholipase/acyl hydrolase